MDTIYFDFETYYDKEYSLTKMTTPEYVCDPRFKVLGVAIAINDEPAQWYDELPDLDYENSAVVAHNCYFDAMILTLHYKRKAKEYICTQALARYCLPVKSHSLKSVSQTLNLGMKTEGLTEGSHVVDSKLTDYAINDVELCRSIYKRLASTLSAEERPVHSLTIRWGVEPTLVGNIAMFREAADKAEQDRADLIATATEEYGISEDELVSNQKFARFLEESLNIDVPKKNEGMTPCLSKGDPEFQAMMAAHLEYQTVWTARIAAKSTINISRPRTLANVCESTGGLLPMPLKWFGAHTGRWSGHDNYNPQNLPNGSVSRTAIEAPPGHVIVVADSSQIELRVNAWWSQQSSTLDLLAAGKCVYIAAAAAHYGVPYETFNKKSPERKLGKAITLGCGFGMGAVKFKDYCASGPLGMDPMLLTDDEAFKAITTYRNANPKIRANWETHSDIIRQMHDINRELPDNLKGRAKTEGKGLRIGPIIIHRHSIELPNKTLLTYFDLRCDSNADGNECWMYGEANYLYGARLQENIVQALARVIISDQILMMEAEGIRTVSSTHDEVLAVCPEDQANYVLNRMLSIMGTTPEWANLPNYPQLQLAAEGGYARNYSK